MKLKDLIRSSEYIYSSLDLDTEISAIATSMENITEGCIYILENSRRMPSPLAFECEPLAILADEEAKIPEGIKKITVKNARLSSSLIHSRFWNPDYSRMKIIGVTGTNGKTTVATMIYRILSFAGHKTGFIGSGKIEIQGMRVSESNYSMTTPDPERLYKVIKKMECEGCEFVVMEVSSHALALEKVTPIRFEYGVFTNLTPEHTDFHSSMEDYFETKKKLLKNSKVAVINIDDYYGRRAAKEIPENIITAGVLWRADYYATNVENRGLSGISYYLHAENFCYKTNLLLPGLYNTYNSLLASAVCINAGVKPCTVKRALSKIEKINGRFEVINGKIRVIIDYAHTPFALENILRNLRYIKGNGKLTVVFGCGGERDRSKRRKMAEIAEKFADKVIVTEDNSRNEEPADIINDILKGFAKDTYTVCPDRKSAIRRAILESSPSDIVAVIGKGAEEYNIDKDGYHPFSEKEIIYEALAEYSDKVTYENKT